MSAEAKNLQRISESIDQHNRNCIYPAIEVRMNPHEVERLGWTEILGLPIVGDPDLGTGAFRVLCARDINDDEPVEAKAAGLPERAAA